MCGCMYIILYIYIPIIYKYIVHLIFQLILLKQCLLNMTYLIFRSLNIASALIKNT